MNHIQLGELAKQIHTATIISASAASITNGTESFPNERGQVYFSFYLVSLCTKCGTPGQRELKEVETEITFTSVKCVFLNKSRYTLLIKCLLWSKHDSLAKPQRMHHEKKFT